jgi:hypothetical protein
MRQSVKRQPRTTLRGAASPSASMGISLPAPTGGWDAVSSLADMKPDRAIVLDNWFPRPDSVQVRRGYASHGTGVGSGVVDSLMVYQGLTLATSKMFAVGASAFYDVSSAGASSITTVTGLSNNRWQYVNFTTSGGKFLWACNGADSPKMYDGAAWTTPSVTGITSSDIVHVNAHQKRLWFTLANSTKAAYLAVESISGAASTFELGSIFTKGGYLLCTATITRDSGAGEDDLAAFISSEGQIAVYQGTDPSSATTWGLVGVYTVSQPIGRRCVVKLGGGLALITREGIIPLPQALNIQEGSAATIAITKNINNAMNEAARSYNTHFGWELTFYPKGTMMLLNVPIQEGITQHQYVMSTLTQAWCRFTGWGANCFAVYNGELYFGGNAGVVYHADTGAVDGSTAIDAIGQGAYNYYKQRGITKNFGHIRALVTTDSTSLIPAVGMSTDYKDNETLGTPSASTLVGAKYDVAVYDTDVYALDSLAVAEWSGVSAEGYCGSIHFRSQTNSASDISVRVNAFDVQYTLGGMM